VGGSNQDDFTDDAFLGGKLHCLQPAKGYRSGLDAVFLAATIPAQSGEVALEAGCGTGIASLCLAAGVENLKIVGLDINPQSIQLAHRNAVRNSFDNKLTFIEGDLSGSFKDFEDKGIAQNLYDHVFANPPFFAEDSSQVSPNAGKATANVMGADGLDKWLKFLTAVVKPHGSITLIHRAEALHALTASFEGRAGGLKIYPLFPKANMPASRVIVQGIKGSRAQSCLLPGQIMHEADGTFTARVQAILRDGKRLKI
jgi:tRNA1(Val) A37 N6-methylase TrmN6